MAQTGGLCGIDTRVILFCVTLILWPFSSCKLENTEWMVELHVLSAKFNKNLAFLDFFS